MKIKMGLFLIMMSSCTSTQNDIVIFSEPQPRGVRACKDIPKELWGAYVNAEKNEFLFVTAHLIWKKTNFINQIHIRDIDSNFVLRGDSLIDTVARESIRVVRRGDSIRYSWSNIDTIFQVSTNDIIKKWRGRYFMNKSYIYGSWSVRQMIVHHGMLSISNINDSVDFQRLKAIAENPMDSMLPIKINPSNQEFNQLVKDHIFSDEQQYYKIKKLP